MKLKTVLLRLGSEKLIKLIDDDFFKILKLRNKQLTNLQNLSSIILKINSEKKLISESRTREFIIDALKVNEANLFGKVFNIGSNKTHKIKDVLYLLKKISKAKSIIKVDKKRFHPSKSEVNKLHCDNKNFLKLFKWKPSNFNNKLIHTFNWYKNNSKLFNASKYNF